MFLNHPINVNDINKFYKIFYRNIQRVKKSEAFRRANDQIRR